MKVLFLSNIPAPYRIDFFNIVGKNCDLTVVFEGAFNPQKGKTWYPSRAETFKEVFLSDGPVNARAISFRILPIIRKKQYDLIIHGNYSSPTGVLSILKMKCHGIPFFMEIDGGIVRQDSTVKRKLKSYLISSAAGWLSPGDTPDRYLLHYGADRERIHHYPFSSVHEGDILKSGILPEQKKAIRTSLGLDNRKTVVTVGNFIPRKGFDILFHAWAKVRPEYQLLIIGNGGEQKAYEALIHGLGLRNIRIVGFMPKEKLFEYYKAADLFVLPTREDIWGLVVNEAMACGLPVVTTDNCVAGLELVENGENGYIVPVGDEERLADAINNVLEDDRLRESMGRKSLEKIRGYTIENMVKTHLEIFHHILKGEPR